MKQNFVILKLFIQIRSKFTLITVGLFFDYNIYIEILFLLLNILLIKFQLYKYVMLIIKIFSLFQFNDNVLMLI